MVRFTPGFSLDFGVNLFSHEKSLTISFSVNLCSNPEDKLQIYRDNFEKAYLDSTERFYRTQAPSYLQQNGVQNYMKYVRPARLSDFRLRDLQPIRLHSREACVCSHVLSCLCLQADTKLREEEKRALRYLETRRECNSVQAVSI